MKTQKKRKNSSTNHLNWKHQKEREAEITRMFNGQSVADAKKDLRVVILLDDINKGIPKDFDGCVFAQACKRQFLSQKVLLCSTVAYISLPDEQGNYRVERFSISTAGKKLIADFDHGILPKPGTAFLFQAPSKSNRLDYVRKYEKKVRKQKRELKMQGKITGPLRDRNKKRKLSEQIMDVRNGTGLIQMTRINERKEAQAQTQTQLK